MSVTLNLIWFVIPEGTKASDWLDVTVMTDDMVLDENSCGRLKCRNCHYPKFYCHAMRDGGHIISPPLKLYSGHIFIRLCNKTSLQNLLRAIYRLTRICLAKFIPLAVRLAVKYHLKDSAVFIRCCDYHLVTKIGYCEYFDPQFFAWTQREPITLWQLLDIVTILPCPEGKHNIR